MTDNSTQQAYLARKAALEAERMKREAEEIARRQQEEAELKELLAADSKAEMDALKAYIESRPILNGFLSEFSILAYDAGAKTNIPGEVGLVAKLVERSFGKGVKSTRKTKSSGNGTGTNFDAKFAAIRPRTKELLEALFGLALSGEIDLEALSGKGNKGPGRIAADGTVWQSRRKMCLALGISKEDNQPDSTLMSAAKKANIPLRDDWFDEAFQAEQSKRDFLAEARTSAQDEDTEGAEDPEDPEDTEDTES